MLLIDTNIFLEILLSRKHKESCKTILKKIKEGGIKAIITDFSLHSII
jgi:predicted nucleic acid-binding protein